MKVLSISGGTASPTGHQVTPSTLDQSTPFGYDLVVVNPAHVYNMYGTNDETQVDVRWKNALLKWSNGKRRIIVLLNGLNFQALNWLPVDIACILTLQGLEPAGNGNYLGNVTATEPFLRRFLIENKDNFTINTYLRYDIDNENIVANSGVDASLITSFTYKKDNVEIIFIPQIGIMALGSIFSALDTPANAWGISSSDELMGKIAKIDEQMNALVASQDLLYDELNTLNTTISATISADVYLTRAIGHYDATKGTDNPSPESYYGAVEAIEKAFSSEREMQSELGLTKNYVDKVMQRANDFRHEARSGQPPNPLTQEEITDLSDRVNKIISAYIQYLLAKTV